MEERIRAIAEREGKRNEVRVSWTTPTMPRAEQRKCKPKRVMLKPSAESSRRGGRASARGR